MSGRERMERRFLPAVEKSLEPGESVAFTGYAMVLASRGKRMLLGASSAFLTHHYWLAVTNRRLLVFRMENVGTTAVLDRAAPLGAVRVRGFKKGMLATVLNLDIEGDPVQFRFPGQYRSEAASLASRLSTAA